MSMELPSQKDGRFLPHDVWEEDHDAHIEESNRRKKSVQKAAGIYAEKEGMEDSILEKIDKEREGPSKEPLIEHDYKASSNLAHKAIEKQTTKEPWSKTEDEVDGVNISTYGDSIDLLEEESITKPIRQGSRKSVEVEMGWEGHKRTLKELRGHNSIKRFPGTKERKSKILTNLIRNYRKRFK